MRLNEARVQPGGWWLLTPLILAAIVGIFRQWHDETRAVRGRVQAAAEAVSSRAGEADVERLARLAGFARLLADDVLVEAEEGGLAVRGREAVAGLASRLSTVVGPQTITLSDIEVTFNDVKTVATVNAVAHAVSASPAATSRYDGQVIHLELKRDGAVGGWLISRARAEPALDR